VINWSSADTTFLLIILLFAAIGALRGFLRSLIGVLAIAIGFIVAAIFYHEIASFLTAVPTSFRIRCIIVLLFLMLLGYLFVRIVIRIYRKYTEYTLVGTLNRLLGFFFGGLQGVIWILVFTMVGLLSPSHAGFQRWASQGKFAHNITSRSQLIVTSTNQTKTDMRDKFVKEMAAWGISEPVYDNVFIDPDLMKSVIDIGNTTQAPAVALPSSKTTNEELDKLLDNDSLTIEQKSKKIWEIMLSAQNFNIPSMIPNATERIYNNKVK